MYADLGTRTGLVPNALSASGEYSFPVTSVQHADSADGTRIAYRVVGTGDPILFVHGSATTSADWLIVQSLLEDRFTVVTMDRRGRGQSADGAHYSIDGEAEDVIAVLAAVGAELLVGHSYGAMCSILAAARTDSLRGLVLYEPPIGVEARGLDALDGLIARGELDLALRGFLAMAGTSEEQLEAIQSSAAWPTLLDAVPTLPRELRACAAWTHPAGPIDVPTLFLRGERTESPFYLHGFGGLEAAFSRVRRATIPDQLHVAHVFAAPVFSELVANFFSGLPH